MKKILLTLVMALATVVSTTAHDNHPVTGTVYVYICTGPDAKSYHMKETCPSNCSGDVIRVTLEEATSAKYDYRKPCGKCCHANSNY